MRLVPPHWRALALVMATATLVGMTISLAIPLLSLVLEDAGVAPFWIGVNTAAGGLGIFLIAPFIRRVVARIGPADAIRLALLVTAGCMLVFPLLVDPTFWFLVRLAFGSAAALMFVLSEAAVNALAPEHLRGRVLGIYATLFSLGFAGRQDLDQSVDHAISFSTIRQALAAALNGSGPTRRSVAMKVSYLPSATPWRSWR